MKKMEKWQERLFKEVIDVEKKKIESEKKKFW